MNKKNFILVYLFVMLFNVACAKNTFKIINQNNYDQGKIAMKKETDRTEVIKIGNKKALELGYDLKSLTMEIVQNAAGWKIIFMPVDKPGFIRTGGDLTIYINKYGEIYKIERGQ